MSKMYMKNRFDRKVVRGFFMVIALLVFIIVAGSVVKFLWNALLPDLFGWKTLSFLQAVGLLLLTRILFGGFGWHKGRAKWSAHKKLHWRRKWAGMNDEEREAFKSRWKDRCN